MNDLKTKPLFISHQFHRDRKRSSDHIQELIEKYPNQRDIYVFNSPAFGGTHKEFVQRTMKTYLAEKNSYAKK